MKIYILITAGDNDFEVSEHAFTSKGMAEIRRTELFNSLTEAPDLVIGIQELNLVQLEIDRLWGNFSFKEKLKAYKFIKSERRE